VVNRATRSVYGLHAPCGTKRAARARLGWWS
jgi:hypothetical protein